MYSFGRLLAYGYTLQGLLSIYIRAHPTLARHAQIKRSLTEIQDAYDFISIGGGTSGLTVADRLTEDPSKNVLVVEYGYLSDAPCICLAQGAKYAGPSSGLLHLRISKQHPTRRQHFGRQQNFPKQAIAEDNANKTGPLTLALVSNMGAFLSLQTIDPAYKAFVSSVATQAADQFLKRNMSSSVVAVFEAQKRILSRRFAGMNAAAYENQFGGSCTATTIVEKLLSRGSVNVNITHTSADPAITFFKYTRKYTNGAALADLKPLETRPGANVTTDADFEKYLRNTTYPSSVHISGTASMLPKRLGGVVHSSLKVYGVDGLRVVDTSIFPLILAAHMSAPVYAVAERAADIIKGCWK